MAHCIIVQNKLAVIKGCYCFFWGSKKQKACENRNAKIAPFLTVLIVADQAETEELAEKTRVAAIANKTTWL